MLGEARPEHGYRGVVPIVTQQLRWLDDEFVVSDSRTSGDSVLWEVNASDGPTFVLVAQPGETDQWSALYGVESAHALDVPGMLVSILIPLAAIDCPVFVASTRAADIVLVPSDRRTDAEDALRFEGHSVVGAG